MLDTLTERERKVLELRFGLGDGYSRTLEEVGRQFQVTRERIRQIEAKALRKMRHPTRIRQLEGFLECRGRNGKIHRGVSSPTPGLGHWRHRGHCARLRYRPGCLARGS